MTKRCSCGSFIPYAKTKCVKCKDTPPRIKVKAKKKKEKHKDATLTIEERMALQELDEIGTNKIVCTGTQFTVPNFPDYDPEPIPTDPEIEMGDIIEDASGHNLSFGCVDRIVKALIKAKVGFKR